MLRALNQSEMMNVNGGFKYIPVYNPIYIRYIRNGRVVKIVKTNELHFTGHLEQVASTDSRTRIVTGAYYVNRPA